jgi:preprotein translocase subunit Sss1
MVAVSLIGMAVLGAVGWVVYWATAWSGCHGDGEYVMFNAKICGAASGSSLRVAAVIGVCLWLAVGVVGFWFRPKVRYLFANFVALYVVALIVLWNVSPQLWGARHCPF